MNHMGSYNTIEGRKPKKRFWSRSSFPKKKSEKDIQCLECGEWFSKLPSHLPVHGLTSEGYKKKYNVQTVWGDSLREYFKDNLAKKISDAGREKRVVYWNNENRGKKAKFMEQEMEKRISKGVYKTEKVERSKKAFIEMRRKDSLRHVEEMEKARGQCIVCKKIFTAYDLVENGRYKNIQSVGGKKRFSKIKVCSKVCKSKHLSNIRKSGI